LRPLLPHNPSFLYTGDFTSRVTSRSAGLSTTAALGRQIHDLSSRPDAHPAEDSTKERQRRDRRRLALLQLGTARTFNTSGGV
jgi:hypothetical protein